MAPLVPDEMLLGEPVDVDTDWCREPVLKLDVGPPAGTPDCCIEQCATWRCCLRMEVVDLRRLAVVRRGEAGGSRPWGSLRVGGSSIEKSGRSRTAGWNRARSETGRYTRELVSLRLFMKVRPADPQWPGPITIFWRSDSWVRPSSPESLRPPRCLVRACQHAHGSGFP